MRDERAPRIASMYLRGMSLPAIARELGIAVSCAYKDLGFIREKWKATAAQHLEEHIAKQLARIDEIEVAAWMGWEKSTKDQETVETGELPKGAFTKNKRVGQAGSAAFLDVLTKCVEQRSKLLGLNQFTPVLGDAVEGTTIKTVEVIVESRDQIPAVLEFSKMPTHQESP